MESQFSTLSPQIAAEDFRFFYGQAKQPACQIDQLSIHSGQCVVLCGPSGSGKSTFLKLLNGLIPEYYHGRLEGELRLSGKQLGQVSVEDLSRQVASVFQNPSTQFFHRTVVNELVFPCENQGLSEEEIAGRLHHISREFQLDGMLQEDIFQLSGGQQQLIAIATAAMQRTDVLVFDEPTANLDRAGIERVKDLLLELKAAGKTLIIAEHRLSYLSELADTYLYFKDGCLKEIYPAAAFLGRNEECRQVMGLRCMDSTVYGERVAALAANFTSDKEGLSIQHLTVRQGKKALYRIDQLCLAKGQVVGLVGQNGSGKSSLASYLVGLKDDSQARISFQEQTLTARERLQKIGLVMQDVRLQLFAETVRKELLLGNRSGQLDNQLLSLFRLSELLERHPVSLSGGEQQRLMIVASLLADKDILIFDEPSSGLDLEQMHQLAKEIAVLKQKNKLLFLISHDEELLASVCDKVLDIETFPKPE